MVFGRVSNLYLSLLIACIVVCVTPCPITCTSNEKIELINHGIGLDNFIPFGDANWHYDSGEDAIVANGGIGGHLVSKHFFKDFELCATFKAESNTNSGIFFRLSNLEKINAETAYEANIWDIRPDSTYATGAIVNYAPTSKRLKAGNGKWNELRVRAEGSKLKVWLNNELSSWTDNSLYTNLSPIALQFGPGNAQAVGGPILWRDLLICDLEPGQERPFYEEL